VFRTGRSFGGSNEFILSSSGHIQSLVNPPGNPKAKYFTSQAVTDDAEEWLAKAKPTADTWWHHWKDWLQARSGESRPAPSALGNKRHQPIEQAPGSYAREA
jgi:polyhydroxyalkanoate synthase subunit PhaC